MSPDFNTRRALYAESLLVFLASQKRLYLLTDMRGNIGDHLIWAGTRDLLDSRGVHCTPLPLNDVTGACDPRGTLLVPGSGAFVRFWHEWLPAVVLQPSDAFAKVVILPSSFDRQVRVVADCLSRDNVFAFAREPRSYRAVKHFGRAALAFDCALFFQGYRENASHTEPGRADPPAPGDTPLLVLRQDQGGLMPLRGLTANAALNEDISVTKPDLQSWLSAIQQASRVVTDRLHVAVAAALLGKTVDYVDPYERKISTYIDYVFRDELNGAVTRRSIDWLLANRFAFRSDVV